MKKFLFYILLIIAGAFTACDDPIDLNVPAGQSFPVLDGWITNEAGVQKIRMTMSVPYTQQDPAPVVNDAKITLHDLTSGESYPFNYNNGYYTYDASAKAIGVIGHVYKLHLEYKGEILEGLDTLKRTTPIDSITYEYKTQEESISGKEGYYARFYAKDPAGAVDYYWVRSYRNDTTARLEDAFSVDGGFDEGIYDGASFILPIQQSITDYDKPFQVGEKIIVRIKSLSKPSYDFLTQVNEQVNAGGLFAKVLENVKSNMQNTTANGKVKVLGRFGTSAVSRAEVSVK
ncbi:DUF4249 domain-containing protein [Chitinophaga sp. sic0106]|uniref:DUF4249 domain-containing protein n=1 Tax=Chitinophaga sp. sic0106 TaxID=2854785 RepID=UPI001C47DCAB|nr:DUF4249 domain-containing protein [Chitinophaga sp. sic0106]MBV7529377.1 DUF4249 domain-containing protein [Chitinophaga sp. sic0106]